MKKLIIATGMMLSLNASAGQEWSWFPAATSQMEGFQQHKENENKDEKPLERSVDVTFTLPEWVDSGGRYDCTEWSPRAEDMPGGAVFDQSRTCDKHSFKQWIYSADGQQLHKRIEWKKESLSDDRSSDAGEMDYVTHSTTSTTGWLVNSESSNCTAWSPATSSIGQGKPFVQTRDCDIVEKNITVIYDHWESGRISVQSENEQTRNSSQSEANDTKGTSGDSGWIYDRTEYGAWQEGDEALSCGTFVYPTDKTTDFVTQRSCDEPEVRNVHDVYINTENFEDRFEDPNDCPSCNFGDIEKRVAMEPETRIHTVIDSQNVDVVLQAWQNDGLEYDCTNWSPNYIGRTYSITQTSSCKQNQKRRRYYQVILQNFSELDLNDLGYVNPTVKIVYDTTDEQTVNTTKTRSITTVGTISYSSGISGMNYYQARSICLSNAAGRTYESSSGGSYRRYYYRYVYNYYLNGSNVGNYSGNLVNYQTILNANPTCIYKTTTSTP